MEKNEIKAIPLCNGQIFIPNGVAAIMGFKSG
jgi:hypothetical protein